MKTKPTGFSKRYAVALRGHVGLGSASGLEAACLLGRRAAAQGMEPTELTLIHGEALDLPGLPKAGSISIKRAGAFFAEAVKPVLAMRRAGQRETKRLGQATRRTLAELAVTHLRLSSSFTRHKELVAALGTKRMNHSRLLKESLLLQVGLRRLTHGILATDEGERGKVSHELHDEIGQTLLAVNVRLLSMKTAAKGSAREFAREIAGTRLLLKKSVEIVRRFALKLDLHPTT